MKTGAPLPPAVLLPLTAAVLVAHAWLLQAPARRVQVAPALRGPAFATRRVAPPPPAKPLQSAAPAAAPAPARPVRMQLAAAARAGQPMRHGGTASTARSAPAPAAQAARVAVPPSGQWRYEVTAQVRRQQVRGSSALDWQHDGRHYTATFDVSVPGRPARRQTSQGDVTAAGLEPLRFGEQSRGEQAAHFERDAGRVSFSNNRPPAPLLAGAQDRLSVVLQLAATLAGDPRRADAGTTVAIQTATTRDAEPWLFTVEGPETLQLPAGAMTTVKLVRPPRGEYDQRMELWLAPGEAYAPVRLRLTQPNGDWADHQWSATDRR